MQRQISPALQKSRPLIQLCHKQPRLRKAFYRKLARHRVNSNSRESFQEILPWARNLFKAQIAPGRPDGAIQLGFISLLIAIEDAAAAEILHEANPSLEDQAVLRYLRQHDLEKQIGPHDLFALSEAPMLGNHGTSSTWNLERLDSLAGEVDGNLRNSLSEGILRSSLSDEVKPYVDGCQIWDRQSFVKAYPTQGIAAINEVLFERHGYQGSPAKEDPRQYQLPHVIEQGGGAPAVLTILYMEICARVGIPMKAALLEEGRYAVLWPEHEPLCIAGEEVVIDVYSEGALFLLSEVRQLFDLGPQPLKAASNRELLGALLSGLRDLHWCKAIGCRTERALTIPLSLDSVMHGNIPKRQGYQIERAIAAAQRCCLIMPNDRNQRINLALLLYQADQAKAALETLVDEQCQGVQPFKQLCRATIAAGRR